MRGVLLGTLTALGIGLLSSSGALAVPVNGVVIDQLATTQSLLDEVRWRSRRFCVGYRWIRWHSWRSHRMVRRVCVRWRHF